MNTVEVDHPLTVTLDDGRSHQVGRGTVVRDLADRVAAPNGLPYVGALVNNDVVSLSFPLEVDSQIDFQTMAEPQGWHIFRRSASFLLAKVVRDLYPDARFAIEHSLGTGFYCSFEQNGPGGIREEQLATIEKQMQQAVLDDLPIVREKVSYVQAVQQFESARQWDKFNLLRFRNPPQIVTYRCGQFSDLAHGPMADRTGALGYFRLVPHPPGFVILFPEREHAPQFAPFEPQPHLFAIFKEHKEWGRILRVRTVGDLNEIIASKGMDDFVKIAEAFHEKKIARIADEVKARGQVKWILIAGPSSSGKTTFAKRLAVQLRVNGMRPVTISSDNYFVNRDATPRDEAGEPDFEHIETIDLALFNEHLRQLDNGEEVELPRFNFVKGEREFHGDKLRIDADQLVIVEGIHGLNPRLTRAVPGEHKMKIYISALTQLNLDFNNRVSTTDNRLIRRIVRDNQFRGNPALATLKMWPSVRRGEKTWIFPFQQEADIAFNSALDYELAALKPFVEPLLAEVKPYHPQYAEARRLMQFLSSILVVPAEVVPPTSILREFIGRSSFSY
jgi:uridine kinase